VLDTYADRWAVVTGASSGIGAEFARMLAARGMHLVLIARREDRLISLAEELHTRHGTRSEVLVHDLSEAGSRRLLIEQLHERGIEVELLVNNAGFAVVGDRNLMQPGEVMDMISVNIAALTELTEHLVPDMISRGHGAVINIASVAAFQPVAYMAAYAASKAYVLHYSEALWAELKNTGVTVLALCPGITRTEFFDVAEVPGYLKKYPSQTPEQVVRVALKYLEKRRPYVVSGWKNYLLSLAVRLAPRKTAALQSRKYFRPQPPSVTETASEAQRSSETTEG